jgi:hypothetical protein
MKNWMREPLLHFAVLGAALFLLYRLVAGEEQAPDEIVITARAIEGLAEGFGRVWQRPPTRSELSGLIEEQIREEVFYREAVKAGLDRDDSIVRRRLRQKMEFLAEDLGGAAEPGEAELETFFEQNADKYRAPARLTFTHVYLSPDRRGDALERDAREMLARLSAARTPDAGAKSGDPSTLPESFESIAADELDGMFGGEFAAKLEKLPPGRWSGPVKSGLGLHLVYVTRHEAGRFPELAEVREEAERDWTHERKQRAIENLYKKLREEYSVRVEPAPDVTVLQAVRDGA